MHFTRGKEKQSKEIFLAIKCFNFRFLMVFILLWGRHYPMFGNILTISIKNILGKTNRHPLSCVATSVLRMRLLHMVAFSMKLRWLAQTKVITLKTQLHAVNARWKRLSQLSFINNDSVHWIRCLNTAILCNLKKQLKQNISYTISDLAKVRPSNLFLRPLDLFCKEKKQHGSSTTRNLVNKLS